MILIRHGQSEFNVHFSRTGIDPGIVDPHLTATGREQVRQAAEAIQRAGRPIARVLTSPYTRALQTARLSLVRTTRPRTQQKQNGHKSMMIPGISMKSAKNAQNCMRG